MIEKRFSPLYGIAMEMMEEKLLEKKEREERFRNGNLK
jgi:hypothetical protein